MAGQKDPTRSRRRTGHHRKPDEAPQPLASVIALRAPDDGTLPPPPPEDLDFRAHEMWITAVDELHHRGLKPADLESIRMMCNAALRAREAAQTITEFGIIVEGERGPMKNPAIAVEKDATFTYLRIAEQYALTFAARLRLGVVQLQGQSMAASLAASLNAPEPAAAPAKRVRNTAKKTTKKSTAKKKTK